MVLISLKANSVAFNCFPFLTVYWKLNAIAICLIVQSINPLSPTDVLKNNFSSRNEPTCIYHTVNYKLNSQLLRQGLYKMNSQIEINVHQIACNSFRRSSVKDDSLLPAGPTVITHLRYVSTWFFSAPNLINCFFFFQHWSRRFGGNFVFISPAGRCMYQCVPRNWCQGGEVVGAIGCRPGTVCCGYVCWLNSFALTSTIR